MRNLAIVAAGIVANVILGNAADYPDAVDVTDTDPRPAPGWRYDGTAFTPPDYVPPEPVAESRIITNLAFDLRFTAAERVAVEMASLDDPSASAEARQQAAYIRVSLQRADKASWVDLDAEVTRTSVQQFEARGLIAEGRATEILDAPVQDSERPS